MNKEIRLARIDQCAACDRLFRPTFTCKECGCFMKVKTRLAGASCPLGKWGSVSGDDVPLEEIDISEETA